MSDQKEMPTMMDVSVEPRLAIPNAQAAIEQVNRWLQQNAEWLFPTKDLR